MRRAQIRIVFDLGDDSNTWVTVAPVSRSYPNRSSGVIRAAHEAVAMFTENIMREAEIVAERLAELER